MKKLAFYSITMVLIFSACVCAEEIPIRPGQYYHGTIVRGDPNVYTFSANVGELVTVLMGEVGDNTNFYPQVELYEPDWTRTVAYGDYSATINAKKINLCGTHRIIAGDRSGNGTGEYGLTMIKSPATNVNEPEDGPVPTLPGEYKSGYIDAGDLDVYTFYADAGDSVTVRMGEVGDIASFYPRFELTEPDGTRTNASGNDYSAMINAKKITQSGICMIIARDLYGHRGGRYGLSMIKIPGTTTNDPEDDPVGILQTKEWPFTKHKNGYIAEGDLDAYSFYANAGDLVTLTMQEVVANSPLYPRFELTEPNGTRTDGSGGDDSATIKDKKITESGIYMIIVRDLYGHRGGEYDLTLKRLKALGTPAEKDFLLFDKPDPIIQQDTITLSASDVIDSDGRIVQVDFYRDLNHNSYLDLDGEDQLYGSDYEEQDGWSWNGSIGCLLPVGENTYFARAKDNDGLWSDPVSTTGMILPLYEVDFSDFAKLGNHWLDAACGEPDWCNGVDADKSGAVDFADLANLADAWLREQTRY